MSLPSFGFAEVILVVVYLVATHYFVRSRVKEELKSIRDDIRDLERRHDFRLDEQELYIRRTNALSELNQKLILSSPRMQSILEILNKNESNE